MDLKKLNESLETIGKSLSEAKIDDEARELQLFMNNDSGIYNRYFIPIMKNMSKFMKAGKYDRRKAQKGFMNMVDAGAKDYVKQFGSSGDRVQDMFPKKSRMELALDYAEEFEDSYKRKEYDFME